MFLGSQTQCHLFSENIPELANPVGSLLVSMICKRAMHWALQWACDGECRHGFIMKVLRLKLHSPLICMNPTQDPWKSPKYVHRVRCVCKNLTAIGLYNAKPTFWFILYQVVTNASSYAIVIAMGICTPSVYLLKEKPVKLIPTWDEQTCHSWRFSEKDIKQWIIHTSAKITVLERHMISWSLK